MVAPTSHRFWARRTRAYAALIKLLPSGLVLTQPAHSHILPPASAFHRIMCRSLQKDGSLPSHVGYTTPFDETETMPGLMT